MHFYTSKDVQANKKAAHTREEAEKHFPGFLSFTDRTEQQIPRPKNKTRRKAYYSGKKKRHAVKTQLMVNNQGLIHKTGHKKGRRHDYDIHKKSHPATPKQVVNVFDLGCLGVEKDFPGRISSLPNKKKRRQNIVSRVKRAQPEPLQKKDSDGAHHLQDEKAQDSERHFPKQVEKIQQGIRYSVRTGKLQNTVVFLEEISHCRTDGAYCF